MSIFDEFMLARQLSFNDGSITLLENRVVIVQAKFFTDYSLAIEGNLDRISELYEISKNSFTEEMGKATGKNFEFNFNDFFKWMTKVAMLAGWGKLTWGDVYQKNKSGVIFMENSPIAEVLKGKVKSPIDHVIRGFIAGGASAAFNADIDATEEECVALGAQKCKFIFGPAK